MNSRDLVSLCAKNLLRRRMRTFLAIIGVVVGTCAIIVMLSIGFGLSAGFEEQMENWGDLHTITIEDWGGSRPGQDKITLDDKYLSTLEKMPEIEAITPVIRQYMTFGTGKYKASVSIRGVKPESMEKFGYTAEEGRLLQSGDRYSVVFGNRVPYDFYNPKKTYYSSYNWDGDPEVNVMTSDLILTADNYYMEKKPQWADDVKYKEYKVKAVGVLSESDSNVGWYAFMNIDTLKSIQEETRRAEKSRADSSSSYEEVMIYVPDLNDVKDMVKMFEDAGFWTDSPMGYIDQMQETASMIQMVLGGIGAISLLVAAFGITNTMIMSIYERTKEIGVMKVIGSNLKDIRKMFLLEAGMIGFFGGVLGVLVSMLVSYLMNTVFLEVIGMFLGDMFWMMAYSTKVSVIPLWLAGGGLIFSTFIGVFSGYFPARRAMNLSALESLKNE